MKKTRFIAILIVLLSLMYSTSTIYAQGVTTSSIKGKITDTKGEPLFPANIVLTHEPTGALYGTISLDDGRFSIPNMKIGGPYTLLVSYFGYADVEQKDIYLQLNATSEFDVVMTESQIEIEGVEVVFKKNDVISSDRTGSMTAISRQEISALPTIKRSAGDLTRLTPESNGNSFGGRNNLYNNFSLDGSIFNNSFGLDYATPGGQADAQPVSLDAIDQLQVSIAPFDVREGGFSGAGVNAVTKSGTNELKATAYYFFRNEGMIGKKVADAEIPNLDFQTSLYGASVGGPIIKNKLFFFLNLEAERRTQLAHGWVADDGTNTGGSNVTSVSEADIQAVQQRLRDYWNYEPGAYQGYNHQTSNNKILFKLDYNISKNHNLTLRYNMLDAWKDILPHPEAIIGRGPTSFRLPFENSSYRIFNKIHSVVGELNSRFSPQLSNNLLIGYTAFRDKRDPHSAPFPVNDIFDANGNLSISHGSEMFSTHNRLNQNVFQITNNLTYYTDKHTLTGGVNFEMFQFENSFNLFYYPWNTFGSVADFLANVNSSDPGFDPNVHVDFNDQVSASQQNPFAWSYVDVAQLGIYGQDKIQATDDLTLTLGLRVDVPIYLNDVVTDLNRDAINEVANFDGWVDEDGNSVSVNPGEWPKAVPLWSPRFGFNWDVRGDKTIQVRGGSGIFTGRIPFVWLGNQSSNPGIFPGYTFQVNATAEKFHYPQVWKNNLAVDVKIAEGWIAGLEGILGKDINAVVHRNYNMAPPTGKLSGTGDTRQIFSSFPEQNIYSADANAIGFLDAGTIMLDNTKEGMQSTLTAKITKQMQEGFSGSLAYTYMISKDYTSIPAEIAADAFQRNPVVGNPNFPSYSWSRYGLRHRFIGSFVYSKGYGNMRSTVAGFLEVAEGTRYSYVYAGDLNQDAIFNNDLLYVPRDQNDINFGTVDGTGTGVPAADAAAQWTALNNFIEQDKYLKERRGNYAERNGVILPWFAQLDIRFAQDFAIDVSGKKNSLQLSFDIMNIGNMFSPNWGVRKLARTTTPISVNGVDNNGTPWLQFNTDLKDSYVNDVSVASKWQMQIGIRYTFN